MALKAAEIANTVKIKESKKENDTIRLWEGYRDMAMMWRTLALIQVPATLLAILLAMVFYFSQNIVLSVPAKPLPGVYSTQEIHNSEFMNVATNFINLIATYQPAIARRQFIKAREYIIEPMLSKFDEDMMGAEIKAIETTKRTQLYFVDPAKYSVERANGEVTVTMVGDRQKILAGKELPAVVTKYTITLITIPRNDLNPYGIAIKNVVVENVEG